MGVKPARDREEANASSLADMIKLLNVNIFTAPEFYDLIRTVNLYWTDERILVELSFYWWYYSCFSWYFAQTCHLIRSVPSHSLKKGTNDLHTEHSKSYDTMLKPDKVKISSTSSHSDSVFPSFSLNCFTTGEWKYQYQIFAEQRKRESKVWTSRTKQPSKVDQEE